MSPAYDTGEVGCGPRLSSEAVRVGDRARVVLSLSSGRRIVVRLGHARGLTEVFGTLAPG